MSHQRDTLPYAERDGGDSASARCPGAPCVRFCAYPPIHRSHSIQMPQPRTPTLEEVFGTAATAGTTRVQGEGPEGRLPLTEEMLRQEPGEVRSIEVWEGPREVCVVTRDELPQCEGGISRP